MITIADHKLTEHKNFLVLVVLFCLALFLRFIAIHYFAAPPSKDALQYHKIAMHLLSGHGFEVVGIPTGYRSPAYPVFLALIYAVFGQDYQISYIVQAFLT